MIDHENFKFNPAPGWPKPPAGWVPPPGWTPDPSWPKPPPGWLVWVPKKLKATSDDNPIANETAVEDRSFTEAPRPVVASRDDVAPSDAVIDLDDARALQEAGIYQYHHPLENAAAYQSQLKSIERRIVEKIRDSSAIVASTEFTLDNSLAKGQKMTRDLAKLMLRAYNAEAENCLRTMRAGNLSMAKKRLETCKVAIARLGAIMDMSISETFHQLRLEELELTSDWLMKKQAERDEQREERARLREERKVAQELAAERALLDKERTHLLNTLASLASAGGTDEVLQRRLSEIDSAIEQNDFRAANVRAGYVYVISNKGAFGDGVVKIGLTRRLEPLDRISELSGASVPFVFDVHTIYFSEDAVALENELHKFFASKALNQVNSRKEFFFATPAEVRSVLMEKVGALLEFNEVADANEFNQSFKSWPERVGAH